VLRNTCCEVTRLDRETPNAPETARHAPPPVPLTFGGAAADDGDDDAGRRRRPYDSRRLNNLGSTAIGRSVGWPK
jgi:hypothetical protein